MIRNTLWTGNPVYPLYDGLFRPAAAAAHRLPAAMRPVQKATGAGRG